MFKSEAPASKNESIRLDNNATELVIIKANNFAAIRTNAAPVDAVAAVFIKNAEDFSSDTVKNALG